DTGRPACLDSAAAAGDYNIQTTESVITRNLASRVCPSKLGLIFVCSKSSLSCARSTIMDAPPPQMSSLDFSAKGKLPSPATSKFAGYHQWASPAGANREKESPIGRMPKPVAVAICGLVEKEAPPLCLVTEPLSRYAASTAAYGMIR